MLSKSAGRLYSTVKIPLRIYSLEGRYATALYSAASKSEELAKVIPGIDKIQKLISKSETLKKLIENPTIDRGLKKAYFSEVLQKEGIAGVLQNFMGVLAENGRLGLAEKSFECFKDMIRAEQGRTSVLITSSNDLPAVHQEKLRALLGKKLGQTSADLEIQYRVDPSLLAGMVIRIGEQTIDMSGLAKMNKIRAELEQ